MIVSGLIALELGADATLIRRMPSSFRTLAYVIAHKARVRSSDAVSRVPASRQQKFGAAHEAPFRHERSDCGVAAQGSRASACGLRAGRARLRHRGNIKILARSGLEAAACGCYRSAQNVYDRILHQ